MIIEHPGEEYQYEVEVEPTAIWDRGIWAAERFNNGAYVAIGGSLNYRFKRIDHAILFNSVWGKDAP